MSVGATKGYAYPTTRDTGSFSYGMIVDERK